MPNIGYDPTGTGNYGVGINYNGTSGVNVTPVPPTSVGSGNSSSNSSTTTTGNASTAIKIASSNLFVFSESSLAIESMTDAIFEDIGGHELIDITRTDLAYNIDSQTVDNQLIKNLSSLNDKYSPKSIASLQGTLEQYLTGFGISLNNYIPKEPSTDKGHIYIDKVSGSPYLDSLIIEVVNIDLENNERVEVEILAYENLYTDII